MENFARYESIISERIMRNSGKTLLFDDAKTEFEEELTPNASIRQSRNMSVRPYAADSRILPPPPSLNL